MLQPSRLRTRRERNGDSWCFRRRVYQIGWPGQMLPAHQGFLDARRSAPTAEVGCYNDCNSVSPELRGGVGFRPGPQPRGRGYCHRRFVAANQGAITRCRSHPPSARMDPASYRFGLYDTVTRLCSGPIYRDRIIADVAASLVDRGRRHPAGRTVAMDCDAQYEGCTTCARCGRWKEPEPPAGR